MTEERPFISIIISVYGQLEHTKRCLHELEKTLSDKIRYEVIIIDDASKDETKEFLQTLDRPFRIFFNENNQGFAKNNNLGAEEARGEYLCLLNNDVFVQGNWLMPMLQVFKEKKDVGIVGNVQKLFGTRCYDHMGVVFSPQGNPRHFGQGFFYRPFKGKVKKWSAVTAACCVMKRELFLKVGGFDEVYLNGCEDVDLCLRLTEQNYGNYIVHDSVVLHVKCASEGRKLFNAENAEILLEKWKDSILSNQSINDQYYHAKTYLFRGLVKPWSISLSKFIEAILIFFAIRKIN